MAMNNVNGDARITRNIVVEARVAPSYALHYMDARELIKFEEDYARYETDSSEEAGTIRSKVSCFNEKLIKFLARFKIPRSPSWSDVTDDELQLIIDEAMNAVNARRGDSREIEIIASEFLKWDGKAKTSDQRVEKLVCDLVRVC